MAQYERHAAQRRLERTERQTAKVAGQHTKIITQISGEADQVLHGTLADVNVQVTQMQDAVAVERCGQRGGGDLIVSDPNLLGVAAGTSPEPTQFQRGSNHRVGRVPALRMK